MRSANPAFRSTWVRSSPARADLVAHVLPRVFGADALWGAVIDASIDSITPAFAALEIEPYLVAVLGHFRNEGDDVVRRGAASDQQRGHQERRDANTHYSKFHFSVFFLGPQVRRQSALRIPTGTAFHSWKRRNSPHKKREHPDVQTVRARTISERRSD
jgi:hypothetical protein